MLAVYQPTNVEDKPTNIKKEKPAILPSTLIHKMANGLPNPLKNLTITNKNKVEITEIREA